MTKVLAGLYIAAVSGLGAAAIGIWRLRCEGFGCMGVGVAWFAWVISFFIVLGIGLLAQGKVASLAGPARATRVSLWIQLAMGAAALAVWVSHRLA